MAAQTTRYTSEQAEALYLARLKRTNPSPEVTAVIRDIEQARQERVAKGRARKAARRKPR